MKKLIFISFLLLLLTQSNIFGQTEITEVIQNAPISSSGQVAAVLVTYEPAENQGEKGTFLTYKADKLSTGYYGSTFISSTDEITGTYYSIQVIEDCVIDSLIDAGRDGDSISGTTLTAGTVVFGKEITKIKLQSGKIIAYKRD